jgi:hypothetical protein
VLQPLREWIELLWDIMLFCVAFGAEDDEIGFLLAAEAFVCDVVDIEAAVCGVAALALTSCSQHCAASCCVPVSA